jgi:hypothetical protein
VSADPLFPVAYYANPAATITYVADPVQVANGYVHVCWTDVPAEEAELQAVYLHVLYALQHYSVRKALSDVRLRLPLSRALREWVTRYWMPRAILEADYSCVAVVTTSAPQHRLIRYYTPLTHRLQTRYFATVAAAAAWLHAPS